MYTLRLTGFVPISRLEFMMFHPAVGITPDDHPRDISYLYWYQVIMLADKGEEEESQRKAIATLADDGRIMNEPDCYDIGRQQYTALRGLIEQFMGYWYHPEFVARISKLLLEGQSG